MESEKKTAITTPDINNSKKNVSVDLVVKSEYILSERPSCLAALPKEEGSRPPNTTNDNTGDDRDNNNNNKNNKSKKKRGQNKKRPRDTKISFADKVCLAVVRGEPCPFQNSERGCRYNHDLKEILANRPIDISEGDGGAVWLKEEGCPFYNNKG